MDEKKKTIPEIIENKPMSDEQLEEVTGGYSNYSKINLNAASMKLSFRRCVANPKHEYIATSIGACPHCGCKEFTIV